MAIEEEEDSGGGGDDGGTDGPHDSGDEGSIIGPASEQNMMVQEVRQSSLFAEEWTLTSIYILQSIIRHGEKAGGTARTPGGVCSPPSFGTPRLFLLLLLPYRVPPVIHQHSSPADDDRSPSSL